MTMFSGIICSMKRLILLFLVRSSILCIFLSIAFPGVLLAQAPRQTEQQPGTTPVAATESATLAPTATPMPTPRVDITQTTEKTAGRLEEVLSEQNVGPPLPFNPLKYAIRASVGSGVPPNTIVLLLLLPLIVSLIAAARHVVGLRGFGIFLPASLAIVFAAIGPVVGIGLFMVIVLVSTGARLLLRKFKLKLQYLPRMALILWMVVGGVLLSLFAAPFIRHPDFTSVSIFPVLILVLLAEDFSKVQLGKSPRTALALASETIILSLVSYVVLTFESIQEFALLYPETLLIAVAAFNLLLGRYVGLRFIEYWRYRRLILKEK